MIYLLLFIEFFKIGLFTVGGGLATLPFLYELADKYDWYTRADITNMIAISESTPGPIGINMATYVGFHTAGVLGGIVATFATVLPSVVIVLLVARFLEKFKHNRFVNAGFYGIRPAVTAMITVALITVMASSIFNWEVFWPGWNWQSLVNPLALVLYAVALFLLLKFKKHPLWYLLGGAVVGIFIAPGPLVV